MTEALNGLKARGFTTNFSMIPFAPLTAGERSKPRSFLFWSIIALKVSVTQMMSLLSMRSKPEMEYVELLLMPTVSIPIPNLKPLWKRSNCAKNNNRVPREVSRDFRNQQMKRRL